MFNNIGSMFCVELRNLKENRVIVSDSSDEDGIKIPKKKRGRPKHKKIKEATIEYIKSISVEELAVQEVKILGLMYNKCIYTGELYDDLGNFVGIYDLESRTIKKV